MIRQNIILDIYKEIYLHEKKITDFLMKEPNKEFTLNLSFQVEDLKEKKHYVIGIGLNKDKGEIEVITPDNEYISLENEFSISNEIKIISRIEDEIMFHVKH